MSGQAILPAMLKAERHPGKLADLKHEMVKASREEVARSLEGNWRADLLFELHQAVQSDPARRRTATDEIFTEDGVFYDPRNRSF